MKYIALLRGINVGGHKIIKMEQLRKLAEDLGWSEVSTYIQSGNILFSSDEKNKVQLESQLEQMLLLKFGFEVTAMVLEPSDFEKALLQNPYVAQTDTGSLQPYVGFLSNVPEQTLQAEFEKLDFSPDSFRISGKLMYFIFQNAGKTKLSHTFVEKKLKVKATLRNWKTINKLHELSKKL